MRDILMVFAKPPVAGRVKTRLQPLLGAGEAATLYRAFLTDALSQLGALPQRILLYFDDGPVPDLREIARTNVEVRSQRGDDLASRMRNAFLDAFASGAERVAVIGTDHPSLPTAFVAEAFRAMSGRRDVVIGPSEDGGYYLLGMTEFLPDLFSGMTFSHEGVFDETVDRAAACRADLTVLPAWYDVDTPDVLPRLWNDLRDQPAHAPATLAVLDDLAVRLDWK